MMAKTPEQFKSLIVDIHDRMDRKSIHEVCEQPIIDFHLIRWNDGEGITKKLNIQDNQNVAYTTPYSPQYTRYKGKRGQVTQFVDLHLDGEFHQSITASADDVGVKVESDDSNSGKIKGLKNYYDELELFGVSIDQELELIPVIRPVLIRELQKQIINEL